MRKKRGKNEGSIFQRNDGRWCAIVDVGRQAGRRQRKYFYGSTQDEFRKAATDAGARLDKGERLTIDTVTIDTYADQSLEQIATGMRPRTLASYSQLL